MAAVFTTTLPFRSALRPPPRRPLPVARVTPPRDVGARAVLRRLGHHFAINSAWFENATRSRTEHQKMALFASETDSPNTDGPNWSSAGDDNLSSQDGPPVLTILAGIVVFLLVLWVLGSIFTWIVGLILGAGKS